MNTHKAMVSTLAILGYSLQLSAAEIFVDNMLHGDCSGTYSIANRDNTGSDGDAYTTAQKAADAARPGDIVYFREGIYYNRESTAQRDPVLSITRSGTVASPITYKNYNNEKVILSGADVNGNAHKFNAVSLGEKPGSQRQLGRERQDMVWKRAGYRSA